VTGVVKKMHGLQIFQDIENGPEFTNGLAVTDNNDVEAISWTLTAPANLIGAGIVASGTDRQSYLKRATLEIWYKNAQPWPCRFVSIQCKARRDITIGTASIFPIMEDGAPAFTPYMSYTTSNTFQKLFKIVKTKDRLLPGGGLKRVLLKDHQYLSRAINGDVEGDDTNYTYRKGNMIWIHIFHGTPVYHQIGATEQNTCCTRYQVQSVRRYYYSWYRMDLTTPTSTMNAVLPQPSAYTSQVGQATKAVGVNCANSFVQAWAGNLNNNHFTHNQ